MRLWDSNMSHEPDFLRLVYEGLGVDLIDNWMREKQCYMTSRNGIGQCLDCFSFRYQRTAPNPLGSELCVSFGSSCFDFSKMAFKPVQTWICSPCLLALEQSHSMCKDCTDLQTKNMFWYVLVL